MTKYINKTINYETTTTTSGSVTGVPSTYVNLVSLGAVGSPNKVTIDSFTLVNANSSSGGFRVRVGSTFGIEVRADAAGVSFYTNGSALITVPIATTGIITLAPGITAVSDGTKIRSITFTNVVVDSSVSWLEWYNTSALAFTSLATITVRTQ